MKISNILLICSFCLFLASCGTEYTSESSSNNTNDITLSGVVVDGFISGANVCLDVNLDGVCSANEPITTTNSSGAFSFGTTSIDSSGAIVSYIATGGVDTATGKNFVGKFRYIQEVNSSVSVYVTPLTDLIAKTFFDGEVRDVESLRAAKQTISAAYPIRSDYVDKSPAEYAGVFVRAQEIRQLLGLIETTLIDASDIPLTITQQISLQEDIKSVIVEDIRTSIEPDVLNILGLIEEDHNLTIADDVKTFINEQQANIKVDLELFSQNQNLTLDNLNKYQVALENEADKAYAMIDGSSAEALAPFSLAIDIFVEDNTTVPDTNTTIPDTNTTIPDSNTTISDDINVSFDGVVVDGYISNALVCIDLNLNETCDLGEPQTTTNENGIFSFSSATLKKDILYTVISSGGIDTFSKLTYSGELKNIIVPNDINNSSTVISTLTDLMSIDFLKKDIKDKSALDLSISTFSQKMGITATELLSDVALTKKLFTKAVYIEHIKRFTELIVGNTTSRDVIKKAILSQILYSGYDSLSIPYILNEVEIDLGVSTLSNRAMVEDILADIKTVLDNMEASTEIITITLPRLQNLLEEKLDVVYVQENYEALLLSVEDVTYSKYDSESAIYDMNACEVNNVNTNVLTDSNETGTPRQSDTLNGLTVESNDGNVSLIYQDLDVEASLDNVLVPDTNGYFSFSFNEAWISKNTSIYIESPNNKGGLSCYLVDLNTALPGSIEFQKVFKYTD